MNGFRRFATSITSRFETILTEIENQDAVITAAIRDAAEARARVKIEVERLSRHVQTIEGRLNDRRTDAQKWKERAQRAAHDDEERALECLRRRRAVADEANKLAEQQQEQVSLLEKMRHDLKRVDARIEQLRQRQRVMRARQSHAHAIAKSAQVDEPRTDVEEIFERWEIRIAKDEALDLDASTDVSTASRADTLESEFAAEEELTDLRTELEQLRGEDAS